MNIDDLTLKQIREIQALATVGVTTTSTPSAIYSYPVGKNVIVRTVTMIYTGVLVDVTHTDLILTNCCWIPDTGRWMNFVASGKYNECEPYPANVPVFINRGSLLDTCELMGDLPQSQK